MGPSQRGRRGEDGRGVVLNTDGRRRLTRAPDPGAESRSAVAIFEPVATPANDLRVTLVQAELAWEDPGANRDRFAQRLDGLAGRTDLVVLPEMFSTGFSMRAGELAEPPDGPTVAWMAERAAELDAAVTGSLITADGGRYYNRLVWMRPDGSSETYDKRHLFSLAGEEKVYSAGRRKLVTSWRGWTVCPQVCYDLRFPAWNRNLEDYDLILFVANWPERRSSPWRILLKARAIENQAWVVGVNRVGDDGNGAYHAGHSAVIDPLGDAVFERAGEECVETVPVSGEQLGEVRGRFGFLRDRDDYAIRT